MAPVDDPDCVPDVQRAVLAEIERAAGDAVERATEEAKAAPLPDAASMATELWADGGSSWRN